MAFQEEQPIENPLENNDAHTAFDNYWGRHDPRESNFQIRSPVHPEDQRHENQADAIIARKFETDLLMTFLLGLQRLTREADVPVLDTNQIEEMFTNTPRQDFHGEYDPVNRALFDAIYYREPEVEIYHVPCPNCTALELAIARDFIRLSPEEWVSKVETQFGLIFDTVGDDRISQLHRVYRNIRCAGGVEYPLRCIRFDEGPYNPY